MPGAEVTVEGRRLKLSNLQKVLYPASGFAKAQVIDYYTRISPVLLPHLQGRALTLKRYPDGVEAEYFYEKECPSHRPDWVATAPLWSDSNAKNVNYCLANDLPTLIWVANLASLELHTSLALAKDTNTPTMVVFDLDPGEPAALLECCEVALWLRDLFGALGLELVAKTSGSKGMQVYLPLNTPTDYEATRTFAHAVAGILERQYPDRVLSNMRKELRKGKVFIDWSQNAEHKTTVCVYSLRARPEPTVSSPVSWAEIEAAVAASDASSLVFTAPELLARVDEVGDLFAPALTLKQALPKLQGLRTRRRG
ncbi:MAG: non-homologous end-joining DNA ligase [Tepidiformaceae bacterium]